MATQIQRRGGSTADHGDFTGADREITVDTDKKTLVVHDGTKQGGYPLARENLSNVTKEDIFLKLPPSEVFNQGCPVGVVFPYAGQNAPSGFLHLNGSTLGALGSGADLMGEEYKPLYEFLWNNMADTEAPVSGGRGVLATDDWLAIKSIQLIDARGRFLIGAGQGEGLKNREFSKKGGEEEHALTIAEMPSHTHIVKEGSLSPNGSGDEVLTSGDDYTRIIASYSTTSSTGGDIPHNNMPPWLALTWIIKY